MAQQAMEGTLEQHRRRLPELRNWAVYAALLPAALIAILAYVGTVIWTVWMSFTSSKLVPTNSFAGTMQYQRLFADAKWQISISNLFFYCSIFIVVSLVLGFLLAVALDQRVKAEGAFRTLFLYPQGMSFIVTGLVWQWIMNPTLGLQRVAIDLGFAGLRLDWIIDPDLAILVLVMAGTWQASGLVMALLLAGLRGIDPQLWSAAQLEGVPRWRYYFHIVLPQLKPMLITATILLTLAGVKVYELVIAMTNGGPGMATEVPTKYIMEYLFRRANVGLAMSAATVLLITVSAIVVPYVYVQYFRKPKRRVGA